MFKEDRNVFTVTWKIGFWWKDDHTCNLCSPIFNIHSKGDEFINKSLASAWRLIISPNNRKNYIELFIQKLSGWLSAVSYEISFLDQKGDSLMSLQVSEACISSFQSHYYNVPMIRETNQPYHDILTIRLKVWEIEGPSLVTEHVFVETELKVERGSSFWSVKKFSNMKCGETRSMLLTDTLTDSMSISFNICKEEDGSIKIKVADLGSKPVKYFKCKFFLLDALGNKEECGKLDIITAAKETKPAWEFPVTTKKLDYLKNIRRFKQNDALSFQCDFAYSTGVTSEKIVDSQCDESSNFSEKNSERLNTLKVDLKSLYMDPILCDIKLQTSTESFPAHSAILSARSPVFRAMFTTNMKEKSKECVYIEDLDAATVRRMLMFLYSDILEDLDWESAKSLYIASDKYDIVYLRHLCATFLKNNHLSSNCCDVLLLAHMHQDSKLLSSVQEFISEHTKEVLNSDAWRVLEKKYPLLTSEILRLLLLKSPPK